MEQITKLYRYERGNISGFYDADKVALANIYLKSFDITKETYSGWWINEGGRKRWVSKTAKKRYAYPTEQGAMGNFLARTQSCLNHLTTQTKMALSFLKAAQRRDILSLELVVEQQDGN